MTFFHIMHSNSNPFTYSVVILVDAKDCNSIFLLVIIIISHNNVRRRNLKKDNQVSTIEY